jgi:hypothetical protein
MTEPVHRIEIIKALSLCWRRVMEDDVQHSAEHPQVLQIIKELKVAGKLFVKSVEGDINIDIGAELGPLLRADDGLREVFGVEQHAGSG